MANQDEFLNGGLVTDKDPALLAPGQLAALRNAVYRADSQSLHRAAGRTVFGTVSASAVDVVGLRDITFDNGDKYLFAHCASAYLTAVVGDTGTFGLLTAGIGMGTQLDRVHYRNRFYLLNGFPNATTATASNVVIYQSATAAGNPLIVRPHGMLPVIAKPQYTTAAGSFSQSVTGYYEYWTTEIAKLTQDGAELVLESTFSSDTGPTTIFVSSTGMVPTIYMPTLQNAGTTHWRIYRSPKKEKETDKKFPTGFMIAEIGTATAAQGDTLTVATATSFPSSFNVSAPFADFASASSMSSDNNVYASGTAGVLASQRQQATYGYNFGGIIGSIRGIQVEVQGYISSGSSPVPIQIAIGRRAADGGFVKLANLIPISASQSGVITSTNSATPTTIVMGTATDKWFPSNQTGIADSEFDGNFMAVVSFSKINTSIGIDYVKVTVSYGATVDSVIPFPTVVYTFGDISAQVGKNGPPPSASTGALYEDTMVVNDVSNPSIIRWSFPGEPEAFPSTYFLDFETPDNDAVKNIKVVNDRLVVGLESSLWRCDYLPSERDASFDRGKAIHAISRSFGIVNPMCACVYSPSGGIERLAFVSLKGLHSTDGFDFEKLADLNWRSIISATSTSTPIALINDPEQRELLFYFRNDSMGTATYQCLHLSYHPDHILPGKADGASRLKVSGMVIMRNFVTPDYASLKSAWSVTRVSGDTSIYLGYGISAIGATATAAGAGKVYRENGANLPVDDATMSYTTRRMYLSGFGNEWRLDYIHPYFASYSGSPILTYTAKNVRTDVTAGEETGSAQTITLGGQKQAGIAFGQQAEGLSLVMSASGQVDQAHAFIVIEGQDFGTEDSGA